MKPRSHKPGIIVTGGRALSFPDFDVSWVGKDPLGNAYWFGSEDGRIRSVRITDQVTLRNVQIDTQGEPINGLAFNGTRLAASTRCEVIYLDLTPREGGTSTRIYEGGARGVLATSNGGFLAPLGEDGLLSIHSTSDITPTWSITKATGRDLNFYKLDHLVGDGQKDYLAVAARRGGLAGLILQSGGATPSTSSGQCFKAPGIDVIDVCSLGSTAWPHAMAGLGADRSIHLCRDIFGDIPPQELRLKPMQGAAYTILGDQHHLFVLTSKFLYAFPGLARRFLAGDALVRPIESLCLPVEAVDIHRAGDDLFIVRADRVELMSVEEVVTGKTGQEMVTTDWTSEAPTAIWNSPSSFSIEAPAALA